MRVYDIMDTHGQLVVYVPTTAKVRGSYRADRRSPHAPPVRGYAPPPAKRRAVQRSHDRGDEEKDDDGLNVAAVPADRDTDKDDDGGSYVEEHGLESRRMLLTYYGIDTSTMKHLKAQHATESMMQAFFARMMTHAYESTVPSMFNAAIDQARKQARQTHEALEGSAIFAKTLAHGMPYMYGVSFDDWNEAWHAAGQESRRYMSALEVARRTLDLLDSWGELAEPELAFPRIVEARPDKTATMATWRAKRPAAFAVGDAAPAADDPRGRGRAAQTVDDAARRRSRWSSWQPGNAPRMIPCSILPLMFLAMCKTRDASFVELNHPWRIMTECRLYLHRIRSLYLHANPGFTRDTIPLPIYSAMCVDDQCQCVAELMYRCPSMGPDRTAELAMTHALATQQRLDAALARIADVERALAILSASSSSPS